MMEEDLNKRNEDTPNIVKANFLDDGFKIKRKSKNENESDLLKNEGLDHPRNKQNELIEFIKIPELNVGKVELVNRDF